MENERAKKNSRFGHFCSVFVWVIGPALPIVTVAPKRFQIVAEGRESDENDA
jgi:hypothetical protein